MKKICFYARLDDVSLFELVDFYSNDIKIFKELGYEVVLSHNIKTIPNDCDLYFIWWWSSGIVPLIKAKFLRKPTVTIGNIHYSDPSKQGYHSRPFYIRFFIRFCLLFSDVQIATSQIEYNDIIKLKAKNPFLVYHAIDKEKYAYNLEGREKFLLTLSHLTKVNVERKKVKEIVRAFKYVVDKYPEYHLYIAGGTNDDGYEEVLNEVNILGLSSKVKFLGRISDKEKIEHYQKCKLFVQPTSFEGFGMALAENMACGTPVITSANGAVPEVVGDSSIFVDPDNPEDIANGIIKLIENKQLYEKLSIEGRKRVEEKFSFSKRKKEINEIIKPFLN
ncbi:MAG: glycosyltransferase family 4 protein [bacterium]